MTSFRRDFKEMTLNEIESTWRAHIKTFGVDGEVSILTPWDNVVLVKELLDRLKAQGQWIKSTDQPPPKDGSPFLCYDPSQSHNFTKANIYVVVYKPATDWSGEGYVEAVGECYFTWEPTHWMPLPEPPKMDDDLEHFLYPGKSGTFHIGCDLRDRGCPECDPSILVQEGFFVLCEKHYEEWEG